MTVLPAAANTHSIFAPANIFTEDATTLPRVNPTTEPELAAANYAAKLANQLNWSNKSYRYDPVSGIAPQFFGYQGTGAHGPTGIGYGGATPGERFQFHWESGVTAVYRVPASQPLVKVWFVEGNVGEATEEVLRAAGANSNLGSKYELVPMPLGSDIVAGHPNANQIWPEGGDRHTVVLQPSTDKYWEMWGLSVFKAPEWAPGVFAVNKVVVSGGILYKCKVATTAENTTPPASDSTHWTAMPGPKNGDLKFAYGAFIEKVSEWNGVCPNNWGAKACGLAASGGSLSIADIVRVLRGGEIGHALGINMVCVKKPALAPSTRAGDEKTVTNKIPKFSAKIPATKDKLEEISSFTYLSEGALLATGNGIAAGTYVGTINEGAKTALLVDIEGKPKQAEAEHVKTEYEIVNPSAAEGGLKDAVPEGAWFAFPPSFTAAAAGISRATEPILYAVHEAIRKHGCFVMDRSNVNCSVVINDLRVMGSGYIDKNVPNPMNKYPAAGLSPAEKKIKEYVNEHLTAEANDESLPALKESLEGSNGILTKLQVNRLEQLAPRAG